ncbi:MAG: hypothetical protein NTV21_02555 [Planctomycetota bacterium]|nr:hypothetical protein [Planctomycetota bacterium]
MGFSCETEFVLPTDDFQELLARLSMAAAEQGLNDVGALLSTPLDGVAAELHIAWFEQTCGENLSVDLVESMHVPDGWIVSHNLKNRRAAALVAPTTAQATPGLAAAAAKVAAALAEVEYQWTRGYRRSPVRPAGDPVEIESIAKSVIAAERGKDPALLAPLLNPTRVLARAAVPHLGYRKDAAPKAAGRRRRTLPAR